MIGEKCFEHTKGGISENGTNSFLACQSLFFTKCSRKAKDSERCKYSRFKFVSQSVLEGEIEHLLVLLDLLQVRIR